MGGRRRRGRRPGPAPRRLARLPRKRGRQRARLQQVLLVALQRDERAVHRLQAKRFPLCCRKVCCQCPELVLHLAQFVLTGGSTTSNKRAGLSSTLAGRGPQPQAHTSIRRSACRFLVRLCALLASGAIAFLQYSIIEKKR